MSAATPLTDDGLKRLEALSADYADTGIGRVMAGYAAKFRARIEFERKRADDCLELMEAAANQLTDLGATMPDLDAMVLRLKEKKS